MKTLINTKTTITVDPSSSVVLLKSRMEEGARIPVADQTLIYRGTVLVNSKALSEYSIGTNAMIFLIVKPQINGSERYFIYTNRGRCAPPTATARE